MSTSSDTSRFDDADLAFGMRYVNLLIAALMFAVTLFFGIAPPMFLAGAFALGMSWLLITLLHWRYGFKGVRELFFILLIIGSRELARRYHITQGSMYWQGMSLGLASPSLFIALGAKPIRRLCRLPSGIG
ncbi:hypothetical protein [Dyella acidisoli]|uniref:Uncharacterized protein n=1 Tax=Dyella acidisoli TaxID=1867834 RepID=A0ABQ5XMH0_9GAMM|nr:hypothetical protein [Dyella acidisoli]GLQ91710.1 hypothetical protein GCM10007901_06600 [Dyella acidisoli]